MPKTMINTYKIAYWIILVVILSIGLAALVSIFENPFLKLITTLLAVLMISAFSILTFRALSSPYDQRSESRYDPVTVQKSVFDDLSKTLVKLDILQILKNEKYHITSLSKLYLIKRLRQLGLVANNASFNNEG